MKLTITIEEEKEGDVRVERPGDVSALMPAEEQPGDVAAMSAGGPPEWLLAELEESQEAQQPQELESGAALDAGPAPVSTNGAASLHV